MSRLPLPIDTVLPELVDALRRGPNAVLRAPTGAGKTTRLPPALLDAGLAGDKQIVVLEPRRLAARAAARWMAQERGGRLGDEVGYRVRFDRQCGRQTRILAVTPGILLRRLQDEPFLESIGIVVFDEFHERSLENDLSLGLVRLVQQTVRPELRIVVMSATLAVEEAARYLDNCPIITSEGRLHPVDIHYEPREDRQAWPAAVAEAVARLLPQTPGDILAFLPGLQEIRHTAHELAGLAAQDNLLVLLLYGDLPADQQDRALLPQPQRRIVLTTNVAETSVTVEGITGVVDSGLARQLVYDARVGLDRLQLTHISQASADQRAGRAGRTQPGVCIRLWSQTNHRLRPAQTDPEIRRVDLSGAALQLLCWGESDVLKFPWLEAPRNEAVSQALSLLRLLGALDERGVTQLGRSMARLPVQPRLGRLILEAHRLGHAQRGALAAALLSERDPFARNSSRAGQATTSSDVLDRIEALEQLDRHGRYDGPLGVLHRGPARYVLKAGDQLARLVRQEKQAELGQIDADEAVLRSLLAAFPDRLCRRREPRSRRGLMVGGRGVRFMESTGVLDGELFVAIDVDAGDSETLVRQASLVERDWLPDNQLSVSIDVEFDETTERVSARRRVRFADLVLEETPAPLPNTEAAVHVLSSAAAVHWDRVRPADDSPAGQYLLRVRCLAQWMPDLELPVLDEAQLRSLLPDLCRGCRSLNDVQGSRWLEAIQSQLSPQQRRAVEREAPERLTVPSGGRIALRYESGRPPVLSARIQELFGLSDTPRLAGGRVRVLLELLAPNYRPQQLTEDLASFWANTYPQVRKELRARYPKHAWPEKPV
jgi:ATP-dependent helicase HrpB